jgi:hypothetical protein
MGSLLFLSFADAIPDGLLRSQKEILSTWQFSALVMGLMLVSTLVYDFLNPHRLAFLVLMLLFLVLLTAKARGMLASLVTLSFATAAMSYVLPPSNTLWIANAKDRFLLAAFICFGIIGSALVGPRQESL